MTFGDFQKQLRKQVADDNTVACLDALQDRVLDAASVQDDFILLQSRYRQNEKAYNLGGLDGGEYRRETAQIKTALLNLIAELRPEDLRNDDAQLRTALADLGLPPLPLIALVNCNRKKAYEAFEQYFGDMEPLPAQFYFLAGCPNQKPNSFSERMVYEILNEVVENDTSALLYDRMPDAPDQGAHAALRLAIHDLPFAKLGNTEACKSRFEQWLAEWFGHFQHLLPKMEDGMTAQTLASMPAHQLPVRYFTFAFRIDVEQMPVKDKLKEYLRWIISTFRSRAAGTPIFQFIFVVEALDHYITPNPEVLDLQDFVKNLNPESSQSPVAWIDTFNDVTATDLENWLRKSIKGNPNLTKIKNIVERAANAQNWDLQKGIVMDQAEVFINEVYKATHKLSDE